MERLNSCYEDYFTNQDNFFRTKLVIINADEIDFIGNSHDLELVCKKIQEKDLE